MNRGLSVLDTYLHLIPERDPTAQVGATAIAWCRYLFLFILLESSSLDHLDIQLVIVFFLLSSASINHVLSTITLCLFLP